MQLKNSFLFGKFRLLTAVNFHTSKLINKQVSLYKFKIRHEEQVAQQSFLIGNHGDNQASKKIRDQKKNKRTNNPYDDVSRLLDR